MKQDTRALIHFTGDRRLSGLIRFIASDSFFWRALQKRASPHQPNGILFYF